MENSVKTDEKSEKQRLKEQKKQERADRAYVRWFAFLRFAAKVIRLFLPYERHDECVYEDRPYVFLCNHYRMIDVMYPAVAVKKPIHFMAKSCGTTSSSTGSAINRGAYPSAATALRAT